MSDIDHFIKNEARIFVDVYDKDHLLIKPETLREFMKGRVVVSAEDLSRILQVAVRGPYLIEGSAHRDSYNALSQALLPTTPDQANEQ